MANPIVPTPTPKSTVSSIGKAKSTTTSSIGGVKAPAVSSIGGKVTQGAIRPKTNQPAKKVDNSPLGAALSFGQSLIDVISTPLYYVEGAISGVQDIAKKTGAGQALTAEDFAKPTVKAAQNALAWTRGQKTITGGDLLKSAGMSDDFWSSLAADILLDPLTYTPGVIFTAPLKAAGIAAKTGIKATKAASSGVISAKVVAKTAEVAPDAARTLKPGATLLTQYSRKPLIKQNLMTKGGETLAKRQEAITSRITEKFTYKVVDPITTGTNGRPNVAASDVIASGVEAAYKAAGATFSAEIAKYSLGKIVRTDAKLAKAAGISIKAAREEADQAEQLLSEIPDITDNGETKKLDVFAPHKTPEGIIVLDDKKIIHTFKTEKQAQNWIKATTGTDAKKATVGPRPVMDTAPVSEADRTLGTLPITEMDAKTAQKMLNTVNRLVKKAKGVSGVSDAAGAVKAILANQQKVGSFAAKLRPEIVNQIGLVAKGADAFELILKYASIGKNSQEASVVKAVMDTVITGAEGQTSTLRELVNGKQPFSKLSPATKKQIAAAFGKLLQGGAESAEKTMAEITALVGSDVAKKIALTKDDKVLDAILAGLPKNSEVAEKGYANFSEFIDGLRNKDQINFSTLEKIVKALDPENKLIVEIQKGLDKKDAYSQLSAILIAKGVQTIYETERRIALVDPEVLFKAQGLSMADSAAAYASGRIAGDIEVAPEAFYASREKAAADIAKWSDNDTDFSSLRRVLYAINSGLGRNFDYIESILGSPDVIQGVSSIGDLAVRNTTLGYQADTKAALLRQINQSGEAKILGSLFGINRKDLKSKLKRDATPAELQEAFLRRAPMMNSSLLAVLGARVVYQKSAAASQAAGKHFVYSSIADFAQIMANDSMDDLLQRALFPDVRKAGITKTDALSTVGIGQAVRALLEAKELGAVVARKDILSLLRSRGELQTPWGATFRARVPKITEELADYLSDPKTLSAFEETHIARAKASVDESLTSAENLTYDLYRTLLEGHRANLDKTIDSVAARADLVRDWFNKFAYASGIFKQQNGEQAQAVFQAAAFMFISGGKLAKLTTEKLDVPSLIGSPSAKATAENQKIYGDIMEAINGFFKHQASRAYAGAGRERLPFPTASSIAKATDNLTEAHQVLDAHIATGAAITTAAALKSWNTKLEKLLAKMDEARLVAWKNNVPTMHRMPDGKWVDSTIYSATKAEAMAKELEPQFIVTDTGTAKKSLPVDKKPYFPSHKALTAEESKKWIAKWREENKVRSLTAAETASQEAARRTLDRLSEYEGLGLTSEETAQRMFQGQVGEVFEDAVIKVFHGKTSYDGIFKQMREKSSGTAGRWTLKPLLNRAESTLIQGISSVSDYTHFLREEYLNVWKVEERSDKFILAFKYALARADLPTNGDKNVLALAGDLRNLIEAIFGEENKAIAGLDKDSLIAAFAKYGLSSEKGFINPRDLNPDQFNNYPSWLPFAEMPAEIIPGSPEAKAFAARAELYRAKGQDPFIILKHMAQAVQFAKTEKAYVMDFAVNFSYKAQGLTFEQAMKQGYVKIEGKGGGGTDLSVYLPDPEKGGLFPPDIAAEFMSTNREWNKIYNDKGMPSFVRTAMEIVGLFKATQTILRPGHHITNAVGDITTAMLAGVRNPIHWKQGYDIAMQFAKEDLKATWGKEKLTNKFVQTLEAYKGYGRAFEGTDATGATVPAIALYGKNGVAKKVNIPTEELYRAFQERGIVIGNIFSNDIQGMYDSIIATPGIVGEKKKLNEVIMSKIRSGAGVVTNPAGSFAAHYGNIPRAAHAMKVIQSRSWSSIDEALNAASLEVTRYHPTVQSLAASERIYPRIAFTYYTWLRVAHNALIDMFVNHTAAMAIPFKVQYQQSRQEGFEPQSIGVPWNNKTSTPNYLNYSVYGPTAKTAQGPIVFKRSILPMDVFDTWNFTYDPAYTMDQNAFNAYNNAGRVFGKSTNLLIQPVIESLTGTDMATGRPTQMKDLQSVGEKMLNSIGTVGLLKGTGLYTPSNKGPTSTDPYTPESRALLLQNWFGGQKGQITETNANIKNAQTEQAARNKAFMERLLKEQEKK